MKPKKKRLKTEDVLKYSKTKRSQATVARYYKKWREEQGIPHRCDNDKCHFHTEPLLWNGGRLGLILDHKAGNSHDNSPEKLQYLCPNCDSQLETRGGKNRGRVKLSDNGFTITERDGSKAALTFFEDIKIKEGVKIKIIPSAV